MALAGLAVAALFIFLPFLSTLIAAALITTVTYPLFTKVLAFVGGERRGVASGLTCVLVILLVVLPAFLCGWGIAREVGGLLDEEKKKGGDNRSRTSGSPAGRVEEPGEGTAEKDDAEWWRRLVAAGADELELRISQLKRDLQALSDAPEAVDAPAREGAPDAQDPDAPGPEAPRRPKLSIPSGVFGAATNVARWLTRLLGTLLAGVGGVVVKGLLMLFIMFYFFKDGPRILGSVRQALAVDPAYQEKVIEKFKSVTVGMLRGILATALTQGVVAGIAFAFLGFPPFLVGSLVSLCALVPVVGTGLVTVPLTIYLLIQAQMKAGVDAQAAGYGYAAAAAVFAVLISSLDNILRPLFVQGELQLHPVWVLLSILGGVGCFGPLGLILGPMVVVLLRTVLALVAEESQRRSLQKV